MYLLLDVGNTNIVVGLYKERELIDTWRMRTDHSKTSDEYYSLLQSFLSIHDYTFDNIDELIISSVVPKLTQIFTWMWHDYRNVEPFIIHAGLKTGIKIGLTEPQTIGSDLLVGAVASYHKYQKDCIILDMGTATTVTAINADGQFLGGSIISGLELTVGALLDNTALLSFTNNINPDNLKAIGDSTESAIQSGIIFGYTGLVDNIIKNIINELGSDDYKIITTGGQSQIIADFSEYIDDVEPNLLFDGMLIIYELNK